MTCKRGPVRAPLPLPEDIGARIDRGERIAGPTPGQHERANIMTGQELLTIARKGRPTVRYAITATGDAIGAWVEEYNRFVRVAGKLVTGEWVSLPVEILIDGRPIPAQWVE